MSAWGKADNKSATGTLSIASNGTVTGSSTLFTTEAAVGDFIRVIIGGADGSEQRSWIIKSIASNTSATVIPSDPEVEYATAYANFTSSGAQTYRLSEKPISIASDPNTQASQVYGVRRDEIHGDQSGGYVSAVALIQGGSGYVEAPGVSFSGGGGSGAVATAKISGGKVTAVTVTNNGSSYETAPTVTIQVPVLTLATSGVDTATDTITYTAHGQTTGAALTYNNGGGTSITGLTSGTTYYARVANANSFTLYDTAAHATAGGATGLMDLSGTGNNAQYFIIGAGVRATSNAALGVNQGDEVGESGAVAHTGWVKRKVLTGAHAGRIQYEVLVAMSKNGITSDSNDDVEFPED